MSSITKQALEFLFENEFVLRTKDDESSESVSLRPKQLGLATALSGISPEDTLSVLPLLEQARRRLVLKTGFHVVFLATPLSSSIQPAWSDYENILTALYNDYPVSIISSFYLDYVYK